MAGQTGLEGPPLNGHLASRPRHSHALAEAPGTVREDITAASCWLCGIRLPVSQLVPDGQDACSDIRWYCRDAEACTARWTTQPRSEPGTAAAP